MQFCFRKFHRLFNISYSIGKVYGCRMRYLFVHEDKSQGATDLNVKLPVSTFFNIVSVSTKVQEQDTICMQHSALTVYSVHRKGQIPLRYLVRS